MQLQYECVELFLNHLDDQCIILSPNPTVAHYSCERSGAPLREAVSPTTLPLPYQRPGPSSRHLGACAAMFS